MRAVPPRVHDPSNAGWAVSPAAIAAWSAVQIGTLAIALLQVPLAAKYPTGTSLALEIVAAGQVCGTALLCPLLFRTPATALAIVASTWPGLLLAGAFAVRPPGETACCGLAVTAWLTALFIWTSAFHGAAARQVVAGAATLLSAGGALLGYLAVEFAPGANTEVGPPMPLRCTPVLISWAFGSAAQVPWGDAFPLIAVLLSGLVLLAWRRRKGHVRDFAMS